MDPVKNFAKGTLLYDISDTDTSLKLSDADAAKFPDPATDGAFNVVIWDEDSHPDPADDPNVEIVRVTASSSSGGETTWTIVREQEGTSASSHSAGHKIMEGPTAKTITDLENTFLKLDQTTPQTIDNGIPLLDATVSEISDIKSLVNKEYIDNAVTALGLAYFMYDEDDATGYKTCYLEPSSSSETYVEATDLSDDDYIGGWISAPGEAPTKLLRGVYNWYLFAERIGGTKTLRLYWKLYERKSDNSEVLIATSSDSNEVTNTKSSFIITLELDSDYIPDSGSRIVGKIYADVSGTGSAPSVKVYYQGGSASRWEIPANSEVWKNIFVPYEGATQDVDLGSKGLTSASVSTDTISEKTADSGVTVDGVLIKDGEVDGRDVSADGSNLDSHLSDTDNPHSTSVSNLSDTEVNSPTDGEVLTYDGDTNKWVNQKSGGLIWQVISTDTTAISGNGYLIDASSGDVTLTLPASPSAGDMVGVCDAYGKATTNTITVARNGSNIEGYVEDLIVDIDNAGFILVYTDATRGWKVVSEIGNGGLPTLADLSDTNISSPADGEVPTYDSSTSKWVNGLTKKIQDADGDTLIDTEESADKDEIVGKVAGVEALRIYSSGILDLPKQSGCLVYLGSDASINNDVITQVNYNTVIYDTQNEFDSSTNYRFTATKAGKYLICSTGRCSISAGTVFTIHIYKNGALLYATQIKPAYAYNAYIQMSEELQLAVNDYIDVRLRQNSGSSQTVFGGLDNNRFSIIKLQ